MSNSRFPQPSPMGVFRGYLPPLFSRTISRSSPSKTQGLVSNELMQTREYLPLLSLLMCPSCLEPSLAQGTGRTYPR